MSAHTDQSRRATPGDWALFAALVAIGGSSFAFIRIAVESVPPAVVSIGRLWIAAIFLFVAMRAGGHRFPATLGGATALWGPMLAVSVIGYVIPFFIFPWAQRSVESGLAGVYMAFMPLWTLGLARIFADEKLSRWKVFGFALGFVGVIILMGPEVAAGASRSSALAQGGLLLATFCYAVSVVISRRAPPMHPRVFAAVTVAGAAALSTPALMVAPAEPAPWLPLSVLSVAILGVFHTGVAAIIIFALVQRVGAGFMSLANYLTPVFAVVVGAVVFEERLGLNVFIALAVILAGVAVSQREATTRAADQRRI